MNKEWYQRRGRLAGKNIGREKENLQKKRSFVGMHEGSIENNFCSGTLRENICSVRATIGSNCSKIKRANLSRVIKTAQFIESDGLIVSTQEAAKIFYAEKERCLGVSRHLNIKQIYIYGKAFLIENRNQNVNKLIERVSMITNTEKVVNDTIMMAIGDIFNESISYVDTKRDRDILKAFSLKRRARLLLLNFKVCLTNALL